MKKALPTYKVRHAELSRRQVRSCLEVIPVKVHMCISSQRKLSVQNLSEESVRRWHSWSGGSAKACLFLNGKEPNGLAAWQSEVRHVLAKASPGELLVRI